MATGDLSKEAFKRMLFVIVLLFQMYQLKLQWRHYHFKAW